MAILNKIITLLSAHSIYLPLLIGSYFIFRLSFPCLLLFLLVVTGLFVESVDEFLTDRSVYKLILNLYTVVETLILALIYRKLIDSLLWKQSISYFTVVLCSFYLLNGLFFQGLYTLNSVSMAMECILMIILSARLFYQLIMDVPSLSFYQSEKFWFNSGVFIYFSLNIFTFLFSNMLYGKLNSHFFGFRLWNIHGITNILLNFSFAMTLGLAGKRKRSAVAPNEII